MIYVGSTNDLKKRIEDHNKGKEFFTKRYKPWILIYYEAYIEEKFARIREMRFKHHGNGLKQLKKRIGLDSFKLIKNGAGFTLIELLVVIGVIAVLVTAVLYLINPTAQFAKARDTKRKSDIRAIAVALEAYHADYALYPSETSCDLSIGSGGGTGQPGWAGCPATGFIPRSSWDTTSGIYTALAGLGYIKRLPVDPINDGTYYYLYEPDNGLTKSYLVMTKLEKPSNSGKPYFRCSTYGGHYQGCKDVSDMWSVPD